MIWLYMFAGVGVFSSLLMIVFSPFMIMGMLHVWRSDGKGKRHSKKEIEKENEE